MSSFLHHKPDDPLMERPMKLPTLATAATLMATTALADIETRIVSFENEGVSLFPEIYRLSCNAFVLCSWKPSGELR
jgi:hypothetical protein